MLIIINLYTICFFHYFVMFQFIFSGHSIIVFNMRWPYFRFLPMMKKYKPGCLLWFFVKVRNHVYCIYFCEAAKFNTIFLLLTIPAKSVWPISLANNQHSDLLSTTKPLWNKSLEWLLFNDILANWSKYMHMKFGSVLVVENGFVMCNLARDNVEENP